MRVLDELHGHEALLEGLWRTASSGRLPHAISFEGPSGVGKFNAALRFASGLLCENGPGAPCGTCAPCKRVRSGGRLGNHPDLYLIDPVEEAREQSSAKKVVTITIKIERIAIRAGEEDCAEGFLRLVSQEDGWRIVILRDAHLMQAGAQNALLKTLEEPGKNTLLILETAQPGDLLPTILSRLVRLRFGRLPLETTERVLIEEGLEREVAPILAAWSEGAPGEALRLNREGCLAIRSLFLSVLAGERGAFEGVGELWKLPGEFIGSTPKARDRHRARVALDVLLDLLGDQLRWQEGVATTALRHRDLAEAGVFQPQSPALLSRTINACLELRGAMSGNVSPDATMERCFLALESGRTVPAPAGR